MNTFVLKALYQRIQGCHDCPNMCPVKAVRNEKAVSKHTDIFIVSQALAKSTLRLSGVNFFDQNGVLGRTGMNLEKLFNPIGYTVYPAQDIKLGSGAIIPGATKYIPVYNTELAQCFPGRNRSGNDRAPTKTEIKQCLDNGFLEEELKLIQPKLVLLMGVKSTKSFYKRYLSDAAFAGKFAAHVCSVFEEKVRRKVRIGNLEFHCLPIHHASPANNGNFNTFFENNHFNDLIQSILK